MLCIGLSLQLQRRVNSNDSARHYGSGLVDVFATPAMIGLMEQTCMELVLPHLEEGKNTVGTEVSVRHLKATPIGQMVTCKATLTAIEDKKLVFQVEVSDESGLAGEGSHSRYIIDVAKFMSKLTGK